MKEGNVYYRTSDLTAYKVVGTETVRPIGITYTNTSYVLHSIEGVHKEAKVFDAMDMNTTRDWATTYDMALSNKIKLLENEIVSLEMLRRA